MQGVVADVKRDYRLYLIDELQNLVLRGFSPQVGGRVLSLPLREVFLPLEALLQARQAAQRSVNLRQILESKRAVLLGDPGSGKTTITRYVAWALADGDPTHVGKKVLALVPLLVRLANYGRALENALEAGDDLTVLGYVEQQLFQRNDFGEYVAGAIRKGDSLVVLDGLDEVTDPALRLEVTRRIQAFVAEHKGNHFLVTSRIIGYDRSPLTRDFMHATLQALRPEDQKRFVELWTEAIRGQVLDTAQPGDESTLVEALEKKAQIARMAANPLLLSIMVLMHWRSLPSRRIQVYQSATDTLIEQWTARRLPSVEQLDAEEIKQILAPIAHHILSTNVGGVIAYSELLPLFHEAIVEQRGCDDDEAEEVGRQLLEALSEQSGLFLERGVGTDGQPVYGFLHQTFGEYLAALHLANEALGDTLDLERYIHRNVWYEPLLLLVGHLSLISPIHAGRLLRSILDFPAPYEDILKRNVLLAADCLIDDVQVKAVLQSTTSRP